MLMTMNKSIFSLLVSIILLFSAINLYAQNPPADVGQNNIIWLEANDLTGPLADGFTWPDKTVNGFDAIDINTGSNTATLTTINGQQYLRFAGLANEQLIIADDDGTTNLLDGSNEFTVVTVFNTGATDTRAIISKRLSSAAGNRSWTMFYNSGFNMFGYSGATTVGGSGSVASAGNPYIATMTVDAALSGASVKMFVNSDPEGSTGSNISVPDRAEDIYIGRFDAGDTRYFNGDIAEIIVYRDALNGGERLVLENYLSQKYGVSIANDFFGNDPDYNVNYNSDIRGIGTADGVLKQSISGFSSGLQIIELGSSLDATNEFLMIGHNSLVAHADNDASNLGEIEIIDRWTKDFYLESNQNGSIDAASVNTQFVFDFSEAGLPFTGSATDYVLLFRDDITGNFTRVFANSYSLQNGDQIVINVPSSRVRTGYYTLGRGTQLISRTWYLLQNGDWSNSSTWTLDAGNFPIPNNPFNEIPGIEDNVVVRSGKTLTIQPTTNNLTVASIVVDGIMNVGTSSGHNFNIIEGTGRITISGNGGVSNFPDGNTTTANGFGDNANGGLLVVNGTGMEFDQPETFRNLRIQLDNPTDIVSLGADITLTGDLTVRFGTLQFGDGTANNRNLTVFGDVSVENNGASQDGRIITAIANARHEFNLYGDFDNEGVVAFTQRLTPDYVNEATNGIVDFNLVNPSQSQNISIDTLAYFYRIEVNKGVDATYIADIQTSSAGFFNLLGPANDNLDNDIVSTDILNANANALGLITGTLKLGPNINIPVLNRNGNYCIGANGRLWIDGATVTKNIATAIVPYGVLEVSAGSLTATGNSGITIRINGLLKVSGGSVVTNNIRTSVQGIQSLGGYQQSGGTVLVDGTLGSGSASGQYYVMSLTYSGNVFLMSDGELTIRQPNGLGALFINSDPGNVNVTGGNVIFETSNSNVFRVTSRAPFYNLNMRSDASGNGSIRLEGGTSGAGGNAVTLPGQDLVVVNDLIIEGYSDSRYNNPLGNFETNFEAITSAANNNDVYVGGSMHVGRNSSYQAVFGGTPNYDGLANQPTDVNTTYFNQTNATSSIDSIYWGVTGGGISQLELGNFHLDRISGNELRTIARNGNTGAIRFDINGNVDIQSGTLDQNAFTFRIWGNITNLDRLGTYFASGSYPVAGGTPEVAQIRFREDPPLTISTADNSIFGNIRFNVGAATTIEFDSDVKMERVEYWNGRIYVKNHTLTIDEVWAWNNGNISFFDGNISNSYLDVNNTGFTANICVFTDGNASDGGLKLKVTGNSIAEDSASRVNNLSPMTFPVGFTLNGGATVYYRPMQMKVNNFFDSGYVQIRAISGELQTTDLSGGEVLRHYWRVSHSDFSNLPTVMFRGYFRNRTDADVVDLEIGNSQLNSYVPAKVLDGGTYQRSYESNSPGEEDTEGILSSPDNANTIVIVFNGNNVGTVADSLFEFSPNSPGFTLENANYTAGEPSRFIGAPTIYYSRLPNNSSWYDRNWTDGNNWSLVPHDGAANNSARPAAGTWPQIGDIAVIGFGGFTGGISPRHSLNINNADNINVAEITFNHPGNNGNRLVIRQNATLTFGKIGGTGGTFMERPNAGDAATINGDFGEFYSSNTFTYSYYLNTNGTYNIVPPTNIFPNLRVEGGNNNRIAIFQTDITVNNNMTVDGNTVVRTNNGANGDITILGELRVGGYLGGNFQFNNGADRIVETGRLWLRNQGTCNFQVLNNVPSGRRHRLIVNEDILQDRPGIIDLFSGTGVNDNNVILEFKGNGNHSYTKSDGNVAQFYQIVMNKGNDISSSFTISEEINIPDATASFQPVEMLNGELIIDNTNINSGNGILLADGSDFFMPNTNNLEASPGSAAMEVRQGTLRVQGNNTGIILDGLLTISGGTLDMATGVGNGNNFIEYTSSGNSEIVITSGALEVGSQVRRNLTSTTGILKFNQSNGTFRAGITAAPEDRRGVFELLNSGSEFTHTGGDFTIVRQNGSSTVASLILKPDPADANITGSAITIGDGSTPGGQNQIGIDATVTLDTLLITGSGALTSRTFNNPLTVQNLTIQNGGTFNANGIRLTVNNDLFNDGTFATNGNSINNQNTVFPSNGAQQISGNGTSTFWDLDKTGSGTLSINKDITVNNQLNSLNGIISTGTNALNAKGDVIHDATMQSAFAGPGLIFNGTEKQNLVRTGIGESIFGTITIDNQNGVELPLFGTDFRINNKVILSSGQFNIGFNLLLMEQNAIFENGSGGTAVTDFSTSNMVTVNTSIVDKGVQKTFLDSYVGTYLFPLGLSFYTPVEIEVDNITASTVNTGNFTIKPINGTTAGIVEDDDETCADVATTDFVDADNVLQYYWLVKSQNITDFDGALSFYHNDALESIGAIAAPDYTLANYGPARLLESSNTWDKTYSEALFDEVNNRIDFKIDPVTNYTNLTSADLEGRYTAGITRNNSDNQICGGAIPDVVPLYVTVGTMTTGDIDNIASFAITPAGSTPSLGESPDLLVAGDFTLNLTNQFWRFRRVEIESGATLSVTGAGVNLGTVTGEGTIKLIDNSNFPAGDYDNFFPDASCSGGGGVEYEINTGSETILTGITNVRRVILSGNGEKVMANSADVNVCNNLEIQDNGTFSLNDNVTLRIKGDLLKANSSSFRGDFSNTEIIMDGSVLQTIDGEFRGANNISVLEIDNSNSVTIVAPGDEDIVILDELKLTNGKLITDNLNSVFLRNGSTITGNFSNTTHIDGPLIRQLSTSTSTFIFPVGNLNIYLPIEVVKPTYPSGSSLRIWTGQFISTNPSTSPLITNANATTNFSTYNAEVANANSRLSSKELWTMEVPSPATSELRVSWNNDTDVGASLTDWQYLRVMGWDAVDEEWESYGNGNTPADYSGFSTASGNFVSDRLFNYSTNFITIGSINTPATVNNALPIELISFEGETLDNGNLLSWSTATEKNSMSFELQRSYDLNDFETIGTIEAAGNSDRLRNYQFIDYDISTGSVYYRLKMIDLDGEFEYSKNIVLNREGNSSAQSLEMVLYPNPVSGGVLNFMISGDQESDKILIEILDVLGNKVHGETIEIDGLDQIKGNIVLSPSLKQGVYIFNAYLNNKKLQSKIMVE